MSELAPAQEISDVWRNLPRILFEINILLVVQFYVKRFWGHEAIWSSTWVIYRFLCRARDPLIRSQNICFHHQEKSKKFFYFLHFPVLLLNFSLISSTCSVDLGWWSSRNVKRRFFPLDLGPSRLLSPVWLASKVHLIRRSIIDWNSCKLAWTYIQKFLWVRLRRTIIASSRFIQWLLLTPQTYHKPTILFTFCSLENIKPLRQQFEEHCWLLLGGQQIHVAS